MSRPESSSRPKACINWLSGAWLIAFFFAFTVCVSTPSIAKPAGQARIAVDAYSGEVLFANRSQVRWHPASLTKMMTLYQTFAALQRRKLTLRSTITISRRAARQPPSKLGLRVGNRISVRTAIEALAVKSANDVAVALAEKLAGNEKAFARRMNKTARWLGMTKTNFRNASGLHHSKQYTTARDMAILSVALIRDFPQYYAYFSKSSFRFARRTYGSHNRILKSYSGADGIKTGYISKAGFNLAASAMRGKTRVVAIVLGAKSSNHRTALMTRLLDHSFKEMKKSARSRIARPLPIRLAPLPPVPRSSPRYLKRPKAKWPRRIPVPQPHPLRVSAPATASAPVRSSSSGRAQQVVMLSQQASSAYAVQVGAYRTATLAKQQLNDVLGRLPGAYSASAPHVQTFKHPQKGVFYRARLSGYDSRADAAAACNWLKAKRTDCAVVSDRS